VHFSSSGAEQTVFELWYLISASLFFYQSFFVLKVLIGMGRLKTWTSRRTEGRIRLSEDDGPAATEFLGDDDGSDVLEDDEDDEPLSRRAERVRLAQGR
jgi:hypothetical protein